MSNKTSAIAQIQSFKEAARAHGADVPEAEVDLAVRKVASAPSSPMPKLEKDKPAKRVLRK